MTIENPLPDLPLETIIVPGKIAIATLHRLREEGAGSYTAVILGDADDLSNVRELLALNPAEPHEVLELARTMRGDEALEKRRMLDEEYYGDVEVGDWPDDVPPNNELIGHLLVNETRPFERVAIGKVPTPRSWEAAAHLRFGGWNECPNPEEHVAILREWHERYGADVATMAFDTLECTVQRPPATREEALALAREQYIYCPDIVEQGTETLAALAATLLNGRAWFFWWD